jgi:LysR family transcriptional regulator, glycine cleavage system transcriptional activator
MSNSKKILSFVDSDIAAERRGIPPFASLKAFESVGRVGGVRKAALELGIDHAVVSRHLRALEAWLGQPLFDRVSSPVRLNAMGREYHRVVSSIMTLLTRATRDVVSSDASSRLLIWCVPGFATQWLAANLDRFSLLHPNIEVELRPTDVEADFSCDEVDGDIRFVRDVSRASPIRGVDCLTFARPSVFPVAAPKWIAENCHYASAKDFAQFRLLHEENDEEWRGWFAANGVEPGARLPGPRLWNAHLTLAAAIREQGVCISNPFLIVKDLTDGRLQVMTDKQNAPISAEIGSYVFSCRSDALLRPAIFKFREWISNRAHEFLGKEAPSLIAKSAARTKRQSAA